MAKTFVALLSVLVLAIPASAQDPAPDDPQSSEPQPQDGGNATSEPTATQASSSSSQASKSEGSSEAPERAVCPLVKSNVGDPAVPRNQWVIVDPYGCLQKLINRVLNWPPSPLRNPL